MNIDLDDTYKNLYKSFLEQQNKFNLSVGYDLKNNELIKDGGYFNITIKCNNIINFKSFKTHIKEHFLDNFDSIMVLLLDNPNKYMPKYYDQQLIIDPSYIDYDDLSKYYLKHINSNNLYIMDDDLDRLMHTYEYIDTLDDFPLENLNNNHQYKKILDITLDKLFISSLRGFSHYTNFKNYFKKIYNKIDFDYTREINSFICAITESNIMNRNKISLFIYFNDLLEENLSINLEVINKFGAVALYDYVISMNNSDGNTKLNIILSDINNILSKESSNAFIFFYKYYRKAFPKDSVFKRCNPDVTLYLTEGLQKELFDYVNILEDYLNNNNDYKLNNSKFIEQISNLSKLPTWNTYEKLVDYKEISIF